MTNRLKRWAPGPWVANGVFVGTCDENDSIVSGIGFRGDDESHANANLIAAAPDLVEALEVLLDVAKRVPGYSNQCDQARAALARAYGETN